MTRTIRERLGLNQVQFARRFGIAVATVRDWEQGRRRPEGPAQTLLRMIAADPVSAQRLLGESEIAAPEERDPFASFVEQWRAQEEPQTDLDAFVFRAAITRIATTVDHEFRVLARGVGLSVGELRVLLALRRAPAPHALRPAELLRQLLVTSGAISKQIDRLERRRLVRRVRARAQLTVHGLRVVNDAMVKRRSAYQRSGPAFARIPASQRREGLRFLRAVVEKL